VAGNSPFRGIVFCNLGTSKTVILVFVTTVNIVTPYLSPYGYPNNVPVGQKNSTQKKTRGHKCINSLGSQSTIASSVFFGGGALIGPYIPDAAIWWCCGRGVGALTSFMYCFHMPTAASYANCSLLMTRDDRSEPEHLVSSYRLHVNATKLLTSRHKHNMVSAHTAQLIAHSHTMKDCRLTTTDPNSSLLTTRDDRSEPEHLVAAPTRSM
jgi:hypothetical protein